jgi:uncharacterized membrane protein YtjA (UPF0391 family)
MAIFRVALVLFIAALLANLLGLGGVAWISADLAKLLVLFGVVGLLISWAAGKPATPLS